jgi:hypothetical protein
MGWWMEAKVRYEFQLAEHMSPTATSAFPELSVRDEPRGTILFGPVRDRSEFYGYIDRFAVMGLTLLDVHRLPD